MRKEFYLIAAFALLSVPLAAQAPPSAGGAPGISYWVGVSISTFNPDYSCGGFPAFANPFSCTGGKHLIGVVPYVDTSFFMLRRVGFEGEARLMLWHGPEDMVQNSFLGGPRFRVYGRRDLQITAKFLIGSAHMDVAPYLGSGNYFAIAPGAAVDFPLTKHVSGRIGYEYQRWTNWSWAGHGTGLTPNGFDFGVNYQIPSAASY
jgi:hypothetical protein